MYIEETKKKSMFIRHKWFFFRAALLNIFILVSNKKRQQNLFNFWHERDPENRASVMSTVLSGVNYKCRNSGGSFRNTGSASVSPAQSLFHPATNVKSGVIFISNKLLSYSKLSKF